MNDDRLIETLYSSIGVNPHSLRGDPSIARVEVHHNRVLGLHLVPGLLVDASESHDGIEATIRVTQGASVEKPVQVCFGMIPETGLQRIGLAIEIEENARVAILAHCTFPFAREVRHEMEATINIAPGAHYAYLERHVHGPGGGVTVLPRTRVRVLEGSHYRTDFELLRGRVGAIDIDLEATCEARSVMDVQARINATGEDRVRIREVGHLAGEYATGALVTHIAVRDHSRAEVLNTLTATAAYARGHVDCKEIVQGEAIARAVPVVEVRHPKAHVTHEAAIGSVDSRQLETLMSRGLTEDEAADLIIQGLLSRRGSEK
ncbi:MAG: SufD family Fe-S cluster assembly protein [Armatimonadetes bacterium]|nr:SufD family Fe-S cluster assembly protein [Armatimonadota bacterium]